MKFSAVRQDGDSAKGAPVPAAAPGMRLLEMPTRLQIPLATRPPLHPLTALPPGARVSKGERVCELGIEGMPAVLAPTSGRIVGASEIMLLNGCRVPAVDIEPDFEDRSTDTEPHDAGTAQEGRELIDRLGDVQNSDLAAWIEKLREAGIWADRRTSPDLLAQLHKTLQHPVDTVICNLLDDESTMRLNGTLAARSGPLLLAGVSLLAKLTEAKNIWVVVEPSASGRWLAPLRREARKVDIDFVPMINDYPQSDPTLLLYALLKRRLKPGLLPVDQRALILDAAAAIAIGRCATRQQPMLQVPFAVRDHIHLKTHLLVVPIGTPLRQALAQIEVPLENVTLRRGDILHEHNVTPDAVITGGDLTLHVLPRQAAPRSDPCIRCSWCVESCPTRIQPAGLLEASQRNDLALAKRYGLDACIECGVCTYVCPSRLPLLAGIRKVKSLENPKDEIGMVNP